MAIRVGTKDSKNLKLEFLQITGKGLLEYKRKKLFSGDNEELSLDIELTFKGITMNYGLMVIDKQISKQQLVQKLEWLGTDLALSKEKPKFSFSISFCILL